MTSNTLVFRPRARLMLLLGDQLIRDAGIAVFELVKNAYDADATKCEVTLENVEKSDGSARIIVIDNGHGMDRDTIENVWLQPGTEFRKEQQEKGERTSKRHRMPLGEKGVGRFAVHKLGSTVELVTRKSGHSEIIVNINWEDFHRSKYLADVPVVVTERDPLVFTGKKTGTRLVITNVRDLPWTRRRARSLARSVTSICSPLGGPDDFQTVLTIKPDNKWLDGLLRPNEVLKHSLFRFKGRIDGSLLTYSYIFEPGHRLDRVEKRTLEVQTLTVRGEATEDDKGKRRRSVIDLSEYKIGPVELDFHIYDLERMVLKLAATDPAGLKEYLDQNGGVRVYRDGMRVYDFGEPGNDWLELGGRRVNIPTKRIGNNQVIGVVGLDLVKSQDLIEKTNREGFVENAAYTMFRQAVWFAIEQAATERNLDKSRIRRAYAARKTKEPVLADLAELRSAIERKEGHEKLVPLLDAIEIQYREVLDRLLVAGGAGLNLAVVLHEVEKGISQLYQAVRTGADKQQLLSLARHLAEMIEGLTWLTRKSGTTKITASELIKQALFNWTFRFSHHHVKVTNGFEHGNKDFTVRGSRRLLLTALMTLIDNSIYWLGTNPDDRRYLYLGTSSEIDGRPSIIVADNGPGFIDPPEYVVQPFITRKPDGMGLGLHIADEIMKTHEGVLSFPDQGEISLPKVFSGAVVAMTLGGKK